MTQTMKGGGSAVIQLELELERVHGYISVYVYMRTFYTEDYICMCVKKQCSTPIRYVPGCARI